MKAWGAVRAGRNMVAEKAWWAFARELQVRGERCDRARESLLAPDRHLKMPPKKENPIHSLIAGTTAGAVEA